MLQTDGQLCCPFRYNRRVKEGTILLIKIGQEKSPKMDTILYPIYPPYGGCGLDSTIDIIVIDRKTEKRNGGERE